MNNEIIKFVNGDLQLDVGISPEQNTVWLTADQICQLFDKKHGAKDDERLLLAFVGVAP